MEDAKEMLCLALLSSLDIVWLGLRELKQLIKGISFLAHAFYGFRS